MSSEAAPLPDLPEPDAQAAAHSQRLTQRLVDLMAANHGFLSFERFMQEALYAPGLGYYSAGAIKFGAAGDFVTAPQLSPAFGHALATQVQQICAASQAYVLELGAGGGELALQVLCACRDRGTPLARYDILELSADLAARQRALLTRAAPDLVASVHWRETLPDAIEGVVLGNEVLDAIPCRLAERAGASWQELGVALDAKGRLVFAHQPASAELLRQITEALVDVELPDAPYRTEFNPAAQALVATLAKRLVRGAVLLIDYGFPAHEFYHPQRRQGSLMAHYRHRAHSDVLAWPGLQDLTAHVDFTAMARAAHDADAELLGYTTQAHFLINCGILDLPHADASHAKAQAQGLHGLQRLLSEAEMGELFKVLAFGRALDGPLLGFQHGDRLSRL